MYILSGDVGGTNSRLEISFLENNKIESIAIKKYKGADFTSINKVIETFLRDVDLVGKVDSVCLAIAGVVINGEVEATNLPWLISEQYIANDLNISVDKVKIINDFEAIGYGIEQLDRDKDIHTLQKGKYDENAMCAVIGAGTGLGMCLVGYNNNKPIVYRTEGGHADFSPVDDEQIELFRFMKKTLHRVSPERFCSGYGIYNIYKYAVRNPLYNQPECPELRKELFNVADNDKAALIVKYAIEYKEPTACRAIDLFLSIYGATAGNLALTSLPFRGLYIAGGIAPRLIKQIEESKFLQKFSDKGRMSAMMKDFPIHIIKNTDVGLVGARTYAAKLV